MLPLPPAGPAAGIISPDKNGELVEVLIGDEPVLTGYVEALPLRYDASSVSMGIVGRSKTADLVDCSALPLQQSGKTCSE